MGWVLRGVVLVALATAAAAQFKNPMAQVFNQWDWSKGREVVNDFSHLAGGVAHPLVHQEEHARTKRQAEEKMIFAAASPITKVCERPGYTGQFCEFPICEQLNPDVDPDQWKTDSGFYIDLTELADCSRSHSMLIDDMLSDVRIELEADKAITPNFLLYNSSGNVMKSSGHQSTPTSFDATYTSLPSGMYFLVPSSAVAGGHCVVIATGHTPLTLSGGFTVDGRERSDFPTKYAAIHQFNSIVLHANSLRTPGKLVSVMVIGPDNYVFRPRLLETRFGCAYEYYFDALFCYASGFYALTVEGIDFEGNLFRRGFPFACLNAAPSPGTSVAPPSTISPTPITRCSHGGILLPRPDHSQYCMCSDMWTGSDCSTPSCVNGGTPFTEDDGTTCLCPIGFHGIHCQEVDCEKESLTGFGVDRPTLVLIVRMRKQMNTVISQIKDALKQLIDNLQFDPDYMSRFKLVFFDNDNIIHNDYYLNVDDVLKQLDWAATASFTEGNCTDSVFAAMASGLLEEALSAKSMVYVVTDALANDHDEYLERVFQYNSFWKASLNFIFVDSPDKGCANDVSDSGFRAFEDLSMRFAGMAWHVKNEADFGKLFYGHLSSIFYRSQVMVSEDREECSKGLLKTVQIESHSENIVIVGRGLNFYPFVTDPNGNAVTLTEVATDGIFGVWQITAPLMGQYLIKAKSNGAACSFRVYQAAYKAASKTRAPEMFWALTADVDMDALGLQPIANFESHPVIHLTEFEERMNPDRVFTALTIYATRNNAEVEIYASNGIYRERCSYHFYFPSFQCRPEELLHFEFFVRDNEGYYVQRAGVMYCSRVHPTLFPDNGCVNGGVATANNTCLCPPHFSGSRCEKIQCEHGSTQVGERCHCTAGWAGTFCSLPLCTTEGRKPTYGYNVDMAFVIENTARGIQQVKILVQALPGIIRDITTQHPEWIERFVLVTYNATAAEVLVDVNAMNTKPLIDKLSEIANSNPPDACVVRTWEALRALLREREFGMGRREFPRRSVINLYEAGVPDVYDGGLLSTTVSEELIERFITLNVYQARNPQGTDSPWFCNAHENDFITLQKAASRGDGHFYTLYNRDVANAGAAIPTLFSSSIVYKTQFADCTSPQNVYFPIDAYTQTISVIVAGYQSSFTLHKYDGKPFGNQDTEIKIWSDDYSAVTEYRNPCDQDWDAVQQYCIRFSLIGGPHTYTDAYSYCKQAGSYLVDDQSVEKNSWLYQAVAGIPVWLGLSLREGVWYFQQYSNTFSPVTVSFWSGGVTPLDPAKACAYFDPSSTDGYWKAVDCADQGNKFVTVCQKHRFDQDNTPSQIGDNDISPGKYFLTVQTTPPATATGWKGCGVEIHVQSDLNIEYGFIDDMRNDEPYPVANIDSTSNRVAASISLGKDRAKFSYMKHVMLRTDDENSTLLEASSFLPRVGCSYAFYSQKLSCEQTGGKDFELVHVGEDDTGNTFQRYTTSFCTKWVLACVNGGVYSNGACVCPEYFTGDRCHTPICQNGGTLQGERRCICAEGYSGDACQYPTCPRSSSDKSFSNDGKTLIVIVEESLATKDALFKLAASFPSIVAAAHSLHSNWFHTYIVHSFLPDGSKTDVQLLLSPETTAAQLKDVATRATAAGACEMPLFEAMKDIFTYASLMDGAEVLLISAAVPLDHDVQNMHSAMEQFGSQSPVVDYVHVETAACPTSSWSANLTNFGRFGQSTGGVLFRTTPDNIVKGLTAFLPTRYAPQRLSYSAPNNCNNGNFYIQIDINMTDVYVSVGGKGTKVWPINSMMTVEKAEQILTSDEQGLWHFSPSFPGLYQFTVFSEDSVCFPYVWGNGGVQVLFGFVQDGALLGDKPTPYAVYGVYNYPVFALVDPDDSPYGARGMLYYSNMIREKLDGSDESPYRGDVTRRMRCTYQYIGKPFSCQENDEAITLSVSGMDTFRQPFTRQTTSWCKNASTVPTIIPTLPTFPTRPPVTKTSVAPTIPPSSAPSSAVPSTAPTAHPPPSTAPPPPSTPPLPSSSTPSTPPLPTTTTRPLTPKELPLDIIFLIDETVDDQFAEKVGNEFILDVMAAYSVDQAHARVGLMTLPSHYSQTMPVAYLSSISSWDSLVTNLNEVDDFVDAGSQEWIAQALRFAEFQYTKPANGYRKGINHLIVMITATTNFNATDSAQALVEVSNILSDNLYGMMAIAYGPDAHVDDLSKFVGGKDCVVPAPDKKTLYTTAVKAVQDKIWRAHTVTNNYYCHPDHTTFD